MYGKSDTSCGGAAAAASICVAPTYTLPDVEEGLNAGTWTVGVSLTGNLLGLNEEEIKTLSTSAKEKARERIEAQLYEAGAHFVMGGIWDLPYVLDKIESRLAQGKST